MFSFIYDQFEMIVRKSVQVFDRNPELIGEIQDEQHEHKFFKG